LWHAAPNGDRLVYFKRRQTYDGPLAVDEDLMSLCRAGIALAFPAFPRKRRSPLRPLGIHDLIFGGMHRLVSRISTSVHLPSLSLETHTKVVPVSRVVPGGHSAASVVSETKPRAMAARMILPMLRSA